jgi:hypothetical protein
VISRFFVAGALLWLDDRLFEPKRLTLNSYKGSEEVELKSRDNSNQ